MSLISNKVRSSTTRKNITGHRYGEVAKVLEVLLIPFPVRELLSQDWDLSSFLLFVLFLSRFRVDVGNVGEEHSV